MYISLIKYWYMLSTLRVTQSLIIRTLATSLVSLRILLILYLEFRIFISTGKLQSLSNTYCCLLWISYNLKISSYQIPLCNIIDLNTAKFSTQISWRLLPDMRSLKTNILSQRLKLRKLRIQWTNITNKLILNTAKVVIVMDMLEDYPTGQTWLVTIVERKEITEGILSWIEMVIMDIIPRGQK